MSLCVVCGERETEGGLQCQPCRSGEAREPAAAAPAKSEATIRMEIRRWCELRGALVYDLEQNRPTRQTPGVSDLIVLWPDGGGCWFVEVKAARGRQSEAQQEFSGR